MHVISRFFSGLELSLVTQIVVFFATISALELLERGTPGFPIDKKRDFSLNLAALLIVILSTGVYKNLLMTGYGAAGLQTFMAHNWFSTLPGAVKIVLAIVLYDFVLYWVHRLMHTPVLWRTHSFHHTIGTIWWLAGTRASLIHLLLFAIPQVFIGYFLFQLSGAQLAVTLSFQIVINQWIHANLWVKLGFLEWLFITPNFHRIHHGAKGMINKNIGFVFTIWDRMFGTFVDPRTTGKDFELFPVQIKNKLLRMMIGV